MPLYDYQCQTCGARVEVMHKIAEGPPACPQCGAETLKKQLSAPSFRLAGAGWYETDFKDKAKQDPMKLAGGAGAGAGEGGDKGGGDKPAGKDAAPAAGASAPPASSPAPAAIPASAPTAPASAPAAPSAAPKT